MKKSMKLASLIKCQTKRFVSVSLVAVLLLGMFTATDLYYNVPAAFSVHAKELEGITSNVVEPSWSADNIPDRDTSGTVKYYYAGNEFYALNQFGDGVQQNGSGTSGHLQVYSDSNGARLVETTYNGKKAIKGNFSGGSDFNTYYQRSDIDFSKTWELMDTNAIWDDQYLFAQYQIKDFSATTSSFTPAILTTVNDWYNNGFSYDGSKNSRPTITAPGVSWFSDAEKAAVKSATVKTDGNEGSSNTDSSADTLDDAKLFAPSIDEMYYNPVQIESVIANLAADKSDVYNATSWQYARSGLWSRSFWGVRSNGCRSGFLVDSTGQVGYDHVAYEFAVAPAFYLDLEQVKMARSAQAGTGVTASSSLAAYNPQTMDTSNGVKFLLQDDNFASGFTSSINGKSTANIVAGNTYTVDYSGAVTTPVNSIGSDNNGKLVISAVIYDNAGKVLYYGPLANATSESGKVSITIPEGLSSGTYTLALFEEQLGGTSTWKTKTNTNNGNTFTQSEGYGTYVNYETDYMSGSVAYMNISLVQDEFDVTINDDATLYAGVKYTARDIDELVSATIGSDSLTTGEYYVMTKDVYEELGASYNDVTTSTSVNNFKTPENPGNDATELTLVFVYYAGKNATAQVIERTFVVEADSIEGSVDFDSNTWYQSTENDITWNYKLNGNGDIIGLYTEDSIVPIVDGGGALNIPSKVAGRTVIAVGGGTEETPVVPSSETSWTSISFPSTVTTINDYAFYNTKAMANIVIPSHISKIGTKAFYLAAITSVKVNEMNGTIGSLAFGSNYSLTNVTLKGGNTGMTVSTIAFRDSGAQSVTIKGKVDIHKNAFKNNTRLSNVNISGNVTVGEYAFTGCTAVDSLSISGTTKINSYAFNNLTCLTQLYLPEGTTVAEYAFNGCSSLVKLESDVNLVNHSFEGCDKISTVILGEKVGKVAYDWEGHSGTYDSRKFYVKNKNTDFEFYGKDGNYISAFGSAGNVIVYVLNDPSVDQGTDVAASNDVMTLKGYTCYAHKGNYSSYITGKASSVTLYRVNSISAQMSTDGITEMEITSSTIQTGIEAYYNGVILTTKDINKDNMTVIPVYGSDEGDREYVSDAFYIIRTTEFNALENSNNVTEAEVSSYEPVHADSADLDAGQETGTISVTVIVFYEDESGAAKYFSTPVTIRVEEYNAKSYVEQEYGSYENIAEELATLTDKVKELEAKITELQESKDADTATITKLQEELNTYKKAYEDLVEAFADYVSANETDGSGYFGTITGSSGVSQDVVYIEGNATIYEETEATTADGKPIYSAEYDTDGDGAEEKIYFYVDAEGVHLTDASGKPTGTVYTDTLGVIERETAAQLLEIKNTLASCENGLKSVIDALKDAGYEIDIDLTIDEQYKQIVDAIKDMADKMASLEEDLNTANSSVSSYESALASIYSLLTGSTLEADDITGINNTLNAIINKIQTLQNNLQVAQATVKDLQNQLEEAETAYSALEKELDTTKEQLTQANAALSAAQAEKDALVEAYEKAIAEGDVEAAAALQAQIAEKQAVIDQLEATQAALEQKEQDILEAQDTITSLQSQIDAKNKEIADLQKQLDALSSSADGFAMTVETANELFGLTLASGSTDEEVYNAIVAYVQEKLATDQTIAAIQALVNSNNTGAALVRDVESAINAGNSGSNECEHDGWIDDSVVNSSSNNYKSGYNAGYAEGIKVNSGSSGNSGSSSSDAATIASLTNQVTSLTSENRSLKNEVKDLEDDVDDLKDEIDDLKDEKRTLNSQVSTLNTKNSELSASVETLTASNNSLKSKNTELSNNVETLTSSNSTLKTKVDSLTEEVSSLKSQLSKSNATSKSTVATSQVTTSQKEQNETKADTTEEKPVNKEEQTTEVPETQPTTEETKPDVMVSGTLTTVETVNGLGNVVQLEMNEVKSSSAASNQKGTGALIKLPENGNAISTINTNGSEANAVSVESINNAYVIMEYYTNHLNELGELGSEEITSAAKDDSKAVILETVVSADIKPSPTQEAAIKNGVTTKVNVSFDGIDNNGLYLMIHESEVREGTFDVALVKPKNGMLEFSLADLSPVTIAKVKVDNVSNLNLVENQDVESVDGPVESNANNTLRFVVYGLIIVALLIGLGVVVYMKLKGSSFVKDDEDEE